MGSGEEVWLLVVVYQNYVRFSMDFVVFVLWLVARVFFAGCLGSGQGQGNLPSMPGDVWVWPTS